MKLTVVIPTHKRARLLSSTIASVLNQSCRDCIAEVVVSENSTDRESLDVVAQFPDLPIRHVFQTPPVDPGTHFARLIDLPTTEWVALIGDDDMWGRHHLGDAQRCLAARPDAVAYTAQFVCTKTDGRTATNGAAPLLSEHLGDHCARLADFWVYDALNIGVDSVLLTPFNMWGLVGRRAALAAAFRAFSEPGAGFDSDRYMFWLLAQQGPVIVGREIGLFYRFHAANACARLLKEDRDYQMKMAGEYTTRIVRAAEGQGLPLKETWLAAMRACPAEQRKEYWQSAIPGAKAALLDLWGDDAKGLLPKQPPYTLKRFVADVTPPVAWRSAARIKQWLRPPSGGST